MNVTYIPLINYNNYDTLAGRIIISTLESQNVDIHVDPIIYPMKQEKTYKGHALYLQRFFSDMESGKYDGVLEKQIQNMADIVLISINDMSYIYVISKLLKLGKKVVLGGPTIRIRTYKAILAKLAETVDIRILARNIIAVKGTVDLSTNLRQIIKDWHTISITNNKFGTIYDCVSKWTDTGYTNFVFKFQCPWMKCEFCNRLNLPVIDFTKNIKSEKIFNNFNTVVNNSAKIVDDYFLFTPKIKEVLDNIKNCDIEIQTGIKELTKKTYIQNLNKYISKVKFGLETMTDYSLKAMNKNQNFKMICKMREMLIRYGDPRKIIIQPFWIIDTPQRSEHMIKYNYDRLINMRQSFIDAGFRFQVYPSFMGLIKDNPLAKTRHYGFEKDSKYFVGTSKLQSTAEGLVRYDFSGKKLLSDIEYIDNETLNTLFL
jgi:hypothetical protein